MCYLLYFIIIIFLKRGDKIAKNKYETHVKPYLNDVKDWASKMNDKQIAFKLGISERTFIRYKNDYKELSDTLNDARRNLKAELRDKYYDIAMNGITETITEIVTFKEDDEGNKVRIRNIVRRKDGDKEAVVKLLNNYDPEWREIDVPTMKNRNEEIEIKKNKFKNEYPSQEDIVDFNE